MSDIGLDGKVVIVTGASQGLGRTMAIGPRRRRGAARLPLERARLLSYS